MISILSIGNISAEAYKLVRPSFPHRLEFTVPALAAEALNAATHDAILLPSASLPAMSSEYTSLGAYGIACTGAVASVRLFSRFPLRDIVRSRLPIYVSVESVTSRTLLSVLCQMEYEIAPVFATTQTKAAAMLLIGDEAVQCDIGRPCWAEVIDMGDWWYRKTCLPFVYAQWVARRTVSDAEKARLEGWLASCAAKAESWAGLGELSRGRLEQYQSLGFAGRYYMKIRTRLGPEDIRGLGHFVNLIEMESLSCSINE